MRICKIVLLSVLLVFISRVALSAPLEINFWTCLGNVDGAVMGKLVDQFNKENPDIKVKSLQGYSTEKLMTAGLSGNLPEIILTRTSELSTFIGNNWVVPLPQEAIKVVGVRSQDFYPTAWKLCYYKGKQYAIPLDIHLLALWYNKKMFKEAGLNPVAPPRTLEDFVTYALKMNRPAEKKFGASIPTSGPWLFVWSFYTLLWQNGGDIFNADETKTLVNSPAGREALQWMVDLAKKLQVHQIDTEAGRTGRIGMWFDGPWVLTFWQESPIKSDVATAFYPQKDLKKPIVWAQSHIFTLSPNAIKDQARLEASVKFIKWISEHSINWAYAGQVPANNAVRNSKQFLTDPQLALLRTFAKELPAARYVQTTLPNFVEVQDKLVSKMEAAMAGKLPVDKALEEAEKEINDMLAKVKR